MTLVCNRPASGMKSLNKDKLCHLVATAHSWIWLGNHGDNVGISNSALWWCRFSVWKHDQSPDSPNNPYVNVGANMVWIHISCFSFFFFFLLFCSSSYYRIITHHFCCFYFRQIYNRANSDRSVTELQRITYFFHVLYNFVSFSISMATSSGFIFCPLILFITSNTASFKQTP